MIRYDDFGEHLAKAVANFWRTRDRQSKRQVATGRTDQGARGSVTGGKQMNGFVHLIEQLLIENGIPQDSIYTDSNIELPGYFRPEKKWDLIVVDRQTLVAAVEFKSQVGPSFGNNFNNRAEEAIGSAQDIWTAYREGAFRSSTRPWLGYLMLLEDCAKSTSAVSVRQPHFSVFPEFAGSSYAKRYECLITKLVRERLYDAATFLMSPRTEGKRGGYTEPTAELCFRNFIASLLGRVRSHLEGRKN